jgi:WD40 repeat protein
MMTHAMGGKKLAKAILTWATCSTRPLTTRELAGALKIDIKDNSPRLEESILAVCGHLISFDKFGRVQLVHGTAREFLINEDLKSEFAIDETEAHTRLARACLTYLTGEEMKPPRTSRRGSANDIAGKRAAFSVYACAAFSYHLARADPLANDVMDLVDKFLKTNVLSWIEVIARTQNLIHLIRAAEDLGVYLNACAAERSPLDRSMQTIRGGTTDLIRVVAKFADALATSTSAIYSLVLPFCPTESMIHKIGNPRRRLAVGGLSNVQWDDRLSCIDFYEGQTSAVCYGDDFLAVGLITGTIALYHATSCQQYKVLNHGEAVKVLQFQGKTGLMASCGIKTIRIWDIHSGEITHSFRSLQRFIGLSFDKNLLLAASSKNYLASWVLENDGAPQLDRPWSHLSEHMKIQHHRTPCAIPITVDHKMLAVAYSGRPIMLWDLEGNTYYGGCGKKLGSGETSTHMVTALVFNPNPNIGLLAASYLDGELVLLDPFSDQELESFRAGCQTLAASPDGRLLAGGAGGGIIQIYEFDTLMLLYRVTSSNFYIRQLAFSRDNLRVSDVRGSQCNVWEPVVLLRDSVNDHSSDATLTPMVDVVASDARVKISAIVLHPKGDFVFCGKDDGSVTLYDLKTGAEVRTLYRHKALVRIFS